MRPTPWTTAQNAAQLLNAVHQKQWMAQATRSQTSLHREMALVLLSALMEKVEISP